MQCLLSSFEGLLEALGLFVSTFDVLIGLESLRLCRTPGRENKGFEALIYK